MSKEVKVPQISEDADSGTVADIYVKEGDTIEEGQDIIGLESDKASVDVPSDAAGKVKSIKVKEGDEVSVGDVILVLEEEDDDSEEEEDSSGKKEKSSDKEDEEESGDEEDDEKTSEKKKSKKNEDQEESDEEELEDDDSGEEEKSDKKSKKKPEDKEEDSDEEEESDEEETEEEKDSDKKDKKSKSAKEDSDEDGEPEGEDEKTKEKSKKKKDKEDGSDASKSSEEEDEKDDDAEEDESDEDGDDGSPTAPLATKFARELGIDISKLQGGDPEKRITRDDVMAYAKKIIAKKDGSGGSGGVEPIELPDFSQWGETEREPLSGIRSAVAKTVTTSWQNIPHVTHHDQADLTELHDFLEKTAEEDGEKLSMTAVLTKISVEALKRFPKFNASLDLPNKEIIYKKYFHVSVAVDTENGLLMPVIKDVDKKPIVELSKELGELAEKARNQKLKPEEMKGGNFAISNLGGIGGTSFTPVIFPPQAAILGVSSSQTQAVHKDGKFEPREMLPLSLSYDHRLIDGADAARFLRWICEVIEQPFNLLTRG